MLFSACGKDIPVSEEKEKQEQKEPDKEKEEEKEEETEKEPDKEEEKEEPAAEPVLQKIEIAQLPSRNTYLVYSAEELDLSGLVVEGIYDNGERKVLDIGPDAVSGFSTALLVEELPVTVSYEGKEAVFTVKISDAIVEEGVLKGIVDTGKSVFTVPQGVKTIGASVFFGSRIDNINLAAANDAIVIALCSADGIAKDNEERMMHCHNMLERGLALGMEADDLWFDPLFLVVKGMQDKQMDVLNAIKAFSDEGLKSTGGLSNNSNGMPKHIRPIMDSALVAMCMMQGLTSAIVNPCDLRLMETIKSCDVFKNNTLYADSYLEI